jgi:hypothetical protein
MTVCRIEPTRKQAEAAYRKATAIPEAWDGTRTVPVRHVGQPVYERSPFGWRVSWEASDG